jgi:hypothetical protein
VLIKPVLGVELVDTLGRLIAAEHQLEMHDVTRRSAVGKSSDQVCFSERPTRGSA